MLLSRCNAARTRLIDCPGCCVVWIFAKRSCAPYQHAHFPPMLYAEDDHMHVLSVLKSMQDRLEAAERTMEDLVGTIEDLVAAGCGQAAPQGASKAAKGAVQVRVRPRWLPALLSIMQSGCLLNVPSYAHVAESNPGILQGRSGGPCHWGLPPAQGARLVPCRRLTWRRSSRRHEC